MIGPLQVKGRTKDTTRTGPNTVRTAKRIEADRHVVLPGTDPQVQRNKAPRDQKSPKTIVELLKLHSDALRRPIGARLFAFRKEWTNSPHFTMVGKGLSWTWSATRLPNRPKIKQNTSPTLDLFVREMSRKKVIEPVNHIRWQSRLFTVPKKDSDKERVILDLSLLNESILCAKFRMLSHKEVKLALTRDAWTTSIDLKDGYWHVPIAKSKRTYLGFRYREQNYQFRALPFGLNIGPRSFTKLMSFVVQELADIGVWVLPYLDDFLVVCRSYTQAVEHTAKALTTFHRLGLIVNVKKSRLIPAQQFEWLGIRWNLNAFTATASTQSYDNLNRCLLRIASATQTTPKAVMVLQGHANWVGTCDATARLLLSVTKLWLRAIYHRHRTDQVPVSIANRLNLARWVRLPPQNCHLGSPAPTMTIQTDASRSGWGFMIGREMFSGQFDESMAGYHINVLELLSIWYALMIVTTTDGHIMVLTDNMVARQCLVGKTTTKRELVGVTSLILRGIRRLRASIQVQHIKVVYNILADQLS